MTVCTSTLANGLRVITDDMPQVKTTSLGIWVGAGGRDEAESQNGVAHLLEHMAFKGTERRDARAIAEEIEAVGGHLNAYTSREQTAYYARTLGEDVPLAIDMLSDILQHSTFEPAELERERDVVIQEIGQANDTPDDIIFDHLQEAAYPGQPLGRSILGTEARVSGMQRTDLSGFMQTHYRAPNLVLVAAGAVDHDQVLALAGEKFAGLASERGNGPAWAKFESSERRVSRELDQAHLAFALPGVAYDDPDFYAVQVYSTLLGGGMSSRLFQEVREKRGLAYSVFAYSTSYQDGGLFTVYAGTNPDQLDELVPVLAEEMHKTVHHIDDAEIRRARAQMKVGLLPALESPGARAEQLARYMLLFGRPLTTEEVLAKVDLVDAAMVRRVADRLIRARPAVSAIGPIDRLESYERFAARFG